MSFQNITLIKKVLCKHNEYSNMDILGILRSKYLKQIENNSIILDILQIIKVEDKFIIENGVECKVTFLCKVYTINQNDEIIVDVISSSYIGTYCYDSNIGKELASFYLSKFTDSKRLKVKIIDKKISTHLTFLVEEV